MKKAVFLERDGVLNRVRIEKQRQIVPLNCSELEIIEGAKAVLERLKTAGYLIIVTTNQPLISAGTLRRADLDFMHAVLRRDLPIDDILFCPHQEGGCGCHKPEVSLFREAALKWQIDLRRSFVVSDKWPDAQAAKAIGAEAVLIQSPWIREGGGAKVVKDLAEAANWILANG